MTFDPKTNRIPTFLLTEEELAALKGCGGPWEFCDLAVCSWYEITDPGWAIDIIYRQASEPLRDIDAPWGVLADCIQHMARDENDRIYGYVAEPVAGSHVWTGRGATRLDNILKIAPGNKPWNESLVSRPKGV